MSISTTTERGPAVLPAVAGGSQERRREERRRGGLAGGWASLLATGSLALAVWVLAAATITAARPGEAMVIALGNPAVLMTAGDADRLRLVRVTGPFVVAVVSGREGIGALYAAGALLVLPGRRGGCGLAG
ncbi:hypothetical protein [Phreatobacter sp.]|uniref:hypothetical protein n=1 Tax=Phreatobacter sp. TaxID=1966341 RepID=UPI003F7121BA